MGSPAGRVQGEPQPESQYARSFPETADGGVYAVLERSAREGRNAFPEEESERTDVDRQEVTATKIAQVRGLLLVESRVAAETRSVGRQSQLQSASGNSTNAVRSPRDSEILFSSQVGWLVNERNVLFARSIDQQGEPGASEDER